MKLVIILLFILWSFFRGREHIFTTSVKHLFTNLTVAALAGFAFTGFSWSFFAALPFLVWIHWVVFDISFNNAFVNDWRHIDNKLTDKFVKWVARFLNTDYPLQVMIFLKIISGFVVMVLFIEFVV